VPLQRLEIELLLGAQAALEDAPDGQEIVDALLDLLRSRATSLAESLVRRSTSSASRSRRSATESWPPLLPLSAIRRASSMAGRAPALGTEASNVARRVGAA